mgnify:CR=1 FL=1|tara:strand:- start:502 stop:903 length:402 start_codon:yes stop_codon:yes gene_type:complete
MPDYTPIKRGHEDNQYYIPKDTFKEIPEWKPTFNYPHPPLFFEGHKYEPTEAIERRKQCRSFMEGITLMNQIAELAEEYDHHPKMTINYKLVTVQYYTHVKSGSITNMDLFMAKKVDELMYQYDLGDLNKNES